MAGSLEWLIVGLGNPGKKYIDTRHNAGWHVLDTIVRDYPGFRFDETRSKGLIARGTIADVKVGLVKPQSYMNNSGEVVGPVARFYKIPPQNIFVIYDELDLPTAKIRIRPKGGAGGHNGMKSVIQHLSTQDFPRMRIGIGRPPGPMPAHAYVLQKFKPAEWEEMLVTYKEATEAIEILLTEGIEPAMNQFNR